MNPLHPIYTAALFEPLHGELVALLRSLSPEDWERPTSAGAWRVRDVVAHLVDGDLRKLSVYRDAHAIAPERPFETGRDLVRFLNDLNADWVRVARRFSTPVLLELLETSGPAVSRLLEALPPHGPSIFPVAWAGEQQSENWMDAGREYTERWHHQMQIRDAVGAPGLVSRAWLHPVLAVSVRALPPALESIDAPHGTVVVFEVEGEAGDVWSVVRDGKGWTLFTGRPTSSTASIVLDADAAWRLFFNAPEAARTRGVAHGDPRLADAILAARGVMV